MLQIILVMLSLWLSAIAIVLIPLFIYNFITGFIDGFKQGAREAIEKHYGEKVRIKNVTT